MPAVVDWKLDGTTGSCEIRHGTGSGHVAFPGGRHASAVTHDLVAAGGRRRHTSGGDVVVLFDGPATAVRAGLSTLVEGRDTRIGLAVAEVAVDGGPVSGLGVDLAVRLGSVAAPGQLLLTTFARVLVSGSDIELETVEDPAARLPDGLPPWRVVTS